MEEDGHPSESIRLRQYESSPHGSVTSDDLDRLLSEDEVGSESSSFNIDFNQSSSQNLPPVDHGRHAWTFLAACWLLEAMIWGFPLAFGIFQSYYNNHELFKGSEIIPTIGTLATGVSYLGMPLTNAIVLRWPQYQRHMCMIGWLLCIIGLIGASFAQEVWQLLLFQGFLYGLGWVICYTPFLFMLNGWFVKRRGLAYGILFGASGISGLLIPLVLGAVLDRFSFRVALRVYAITVVVISGPGFLLIKPRIPETSKPIPDVAVQAKPRDRDSLQRVLRSPHFIVFALAIFFQGLAFFLPNIFLPSYASALSLSQTKANSLLAMTSLSQVSGQIALGYVSDKWNPYYLTSFAALISGISAIFLWGPAKEMSRLAPFALLWGFWSASYSVLYTSTVNYLTPDHDLGMTIYGIFSFERGIANILEGPVSGWLVGERTIQVDLFALGKYSGVVWFTSVCMLLSSLGIFGLLKGKRK